MADIRSTLDIRSTVAASRRLCCIGCTGRVNEARRPTCVRSRQLPR